jgi:hypothetical protein
MRGFVAAIAGLGCLSVAMPVQACVKVTPAVRAWTQCGYKVASETGDHKFMVNFAKAKELGHKLLPSAEPRWNNLEPRIVADCGSYDRAAAKDQKTLAALRKSGGSFYVPENQFEAIFGTGDISVLVKPNA